MVITHDGSGIPVLSEPWGIGDKDWIWMVWDDYLDGASIVTSEWTLPDQFTSHDTKTSQSVKDEETGTEYSAANAVLVSSSSRGKFVVSNKITLDNDEEYTRSVEVPVRTL